MSNHLKTYPNVKTYPNWHSTCRYISGLLAGIALSAHAETLRLTTPPVEEGAHAESSHYYHKLLDLVLSKTLPTYGPYEITQFPHALTRSRFQYELKNNRIINVFWAPTNNIRESELRPIRISLLKGLNGYRIFLIRKEDQGIFKKIANLDDLRKFKAGQGSNWPDTPILTANRLPLVTSQEFEPLFNMLRGKRFDYFPRGVDEIWSEAALFEQKGLVIEQHLMLRYEAPRYFFVNKANKALAERIEKGLQLAIADGSFDALFNSIPGYQQGFAEITAKKRRVFDLELPPNSDD